MTVNKKTTRRAATPKAKAFTAAQQANLASVRKAAFATGVARTVVVAETAKALGKSPVLALYNAAKLELQIGFMGAAMARKAVKGLADLSDEQLMAHCRDRILNYQGHGGSAKLRAGSKGRRTKAEEEAYLSARVQVSGIMRDAGVKVPEARGGDTSKTRTARPAAKASKGNAKSAASDKPVVRKLATKAEVMNYLQLQASAMLASINRSAKVVPIEAKSAVQDFKAAIAKIA